MLIDRNNKFVSQRQLPMLTKIEAIYRSREITLKFEESSITVDPASLKVMRAATVWNDTIEVLDAGDSTSEWLNHTLGLTNKKQVRLVYMPDSCQRKVDKQYAKHNQTVSFADGFPLLLISQASLDLLNSKLTIPVPMNRFRPNIVIDGCEPHAEDTWNKIKIGDTEFEVSKPCSRCVVPSIDQLTGDKDNEILERLREYRLGEDRQIYFGQNLIYKLTNNEKPIISIGDKIDLID